VLVGVGVWSRTLLVLVRMRTDVLHQLGPVVWRLRPRGVVHGVHGVGVGVVNRSRRGSNRGTVILACLKLEVLAAGVGVTVHMVVGVVVHVVVGVHVVVLVNVGSWRLRGGFSGSAGCSRVTTCTSILASFEFYVLAAGVRVTVDVVVGMVVHVVVLVNMGRWRLRSGFSGSAGCGRVTTCTGVLTSDKRRAVFTARVVVDSGGRIGELVDSMNSVGNLLPLAGRADGVLNHLTTKQRLDLASGNCDIVRAAVAGGSEGRASEKGSSDNSRSELDHIDLF